MLNPNFVRPKKWCEFHQVDTHDTSECRKGGLLYGGGKGDGLLSGAKGDGTSGGGKGAVVSGAPAVGGPAVGGKGEAAVVESR